MSLYTICLSFVRKNKDKFDLTVLPRTIIDDIQTYRDYIEITLENMTKLSSISDELCFRYGIHTDDKIPTDPEVGKYSYFQNSLDIFLHYGLQNKLFMIVTDVQSIKDNRLYGDYAYLKIIAGIE